MNCVATELLELQKQIVNATWNLMRRPAASSAEPDERLIEEVGVVPVSVGKGVYEWRDPGSPFLVRFLDVVIRGRPEPTEHTEMNWFEPDSLVTVRLAPCDASFVADYLLRVPD